MKNILLATAAAAALLFAPVIASAQYPNATPGAQPITTPEASTTAPSTTAPSTTAQTPTDGSATAPSQPSATAQTTSPAHGSGQTAIASAGQVRGQLISDTKALELAQGAGMQAVPMSAAAVCQPRELDLTGGATHDNSNQLEFAVDRASVCELQEIEIPSRGASTFRQALIRQGVDEAKIVVDDGGANEARMTFAGIATSGGQYAALYNPVRTAANTPTQDLSYAPSPSPSASPSASPLSSDEPQSTTPSATTPDHSSMGHSMDDMNQPSPTATAPPTL